jgi:glutamine synthetase type III
MINDALTQRLCNLTITVIINNMQADHANYVISGYGYSRERDWIANVSRGLSREIWW